MDKCGATEAFDSELWEEIIIAKDGVITIKHAIHTLHLRVHDFLEANFSARRVVSKVKNVTQKTHNRIVFKHNNKALPKGF